MTKGQKYITVTIETEENLPKFKGDYYVLKFNSAIKIHFDPDIKLCVRNWMRSHKVYLLPIY